MGITTIILLGILIILWLYLSIIGTIAIKNDNTLSAFQKKAQTTVVWVLPYIGSYLIIYTVNQCSPEAIPGKFIPWPFKNFILGNSEKSNPHRDDNGHSGIHLSISHNQHNCSGGGTDGGGSSACD